MKRCNRLSALLALSRLTGIAHVGAVEFHVALLGSDQNAGSATQPFATPERARDAVRMLRAQGRWPADGVTVWLHAGDYVRTNALELTVGDSGEPGRPVTWRAPEGQRVRWLGGRIVTGFNPIVDATILNRLDPAARGQVLQADLSLLVPTGVLAKGGMKSRGFSRATTASHPELFFGGRPMTLARWPNEGSTEKIAGFPETSGQGDDHGGKIGQVSGGFLYAGDRP